jgi:large subunit ribosomal protein L18
MEKGISYKKALARTKRKMHIRNHLHGTAERPRLVVFRSLKHIYAQLIDDDKGVTIVSSSDVAKDFKAEGKKKTEISFAVGKHIAEKAIAAGVKKVCFDRSGYLYHGRVKAVAEGARKAGLDF